MSATDEIYKFFADYIYKNSGILYKESDFYRLDTRLNTMVKELGLKDVDEVYNKYKSNISADMHSLLINIATNNETYFMRDNKPFATLVKSIIPRILENNPSAVKLPIWCAGCSTGQEPYSILMSVDSNSDPAVFKKVNIEATDISTKALNKAKGGIYDGLDVQRGLPIPMLVKYFTKDGDEDWKIKDELKSKISFGEFNLLKDAFPKEKYDIIFCRNVLIYQDRENRRKILEQFYDALKSGGFLFMGSGESIIGLNLKFKQEIVEGTLVYNKE